MKIVSWNLLHRAGAGLGDVADLIGRYQPDLLLMQEATEMFAGLTTIVGGAFVREPLPGRAHGLAVWMPAPTRQPPVVFALPAGTFVRRICQIVDFDSFAVANVHLSHGQMMNRRQLRFIARRLPPRAALMGDYNMLGPALLPGFHDAGPRRETHRMSGRLPLRLDRCLLRGLVCEQADVLPRGASDHHPIMLRLTIALEVGQQQPHGRVSKMPK